MSAGLKNKKARLGGGPLFRSHDSRADLHHLHIDRFRFHPLRLQEREVKYPLLKLGLHLLLVDHIRQREGPDETAVRPLDPMILLHFD
jgi:hypothetical protein